MKFADFFIENRKFTWVLMIGLFLYGMNGLMSLKSEAFPEVNIGSVIITTRYPGASAEDIETKITKPIEDEIRTVRGLDEVKSVSQTGISRITTVVDIDNYDVEKVISDLQRAIDRTPDLPSDLRSPPDFLEVKSDEFPVIELAVIGSNEGRARDLIAKELKEDLEDNKKIGNIILTGYRERRFNILLNRNALQRYHVGVDEVAAKISAQNLNIPGGKLETKSNLTILRVEGKMKSVKQLEQLVVRSNFSGERILLKDIATVEDGMEDARSLALHEGRPSTLITIAKKGGSDIIKLADEVQAVIASFEKKYPDHKFEVYNSEGTRVSNRLNVLSSNGLAGLGLVVFFLLLFLPGRVGIMASLSLPLAVLATFGYMSSNGMTLNTITILAMVISLGMLVDNAVVISENFVRLRKNGLDQKAAAVKSISDLWLPITATAFTTIAAFLPMLVTKGVIGQFIQGIPIIVTVSLIISLGESFFFLPVRLVSGKKANANKIIENPKEDWFEKSIQPIFRKIITWLVGHRYISALIFMGLIGGAVFMMAVVNKFILFPADQTEIYISRIELPRQSKMEVTEAKLQELSSHVKNKLGDNVAHIVGKVGISEKDFGDPKSKRGENVAMLFLFMTEEAKNTLKTNNVLKDLRSIKLEGTTDLSFEAAANGPPVGDPVTTVFRSNDVESLDKITAIIMEDLKQVDGVFDVRLDDVFEADEIFIELDQDKAGRLGLDLAMVGRTVRMAMAGERLSDVNLNNRTVDYFVRLSDQDRARKDQLAGLRIMDRRGNLIRLNQVVSLEAHKGSAQVKRFDFKRAKTVTANINDDIITSVEANRIVAESFARISGDFKDVSLEFGGEAERTQESMQSLASALVLSLIGIFALLVFLFKSYVRPVIILTTIPLGLIGVAISFFLHGKPLSFLAMIGVVGLGGIIVNSGIVLISFIEQLRAENVDRPLSEVLIEASSLRLKAVVITTLTTICGLLPTAYGIGGSDDFIIPMTLALAWGLMSGSILTLFWVPCAYAITEDIGKLRLPFMKRKA